MDRTCGLSFVRAHHYCSKLVWDQVVKLGPTQDPVLVLLVKKLFLFSKVLLLLNTTWSNTLVSFMSHESKVMSTRSSSSTGLTLVL